MKAKAFAITGAMALFAAVQAADYILTIDGKSSELDLDTPSAITLPDGSKAQARLRKKEFLNFKSEMLSFDHPSRLAPVKTKLSDQISQIMIASACGNIIMLQEYSGVKASAVVDLMIDSLLEEKKKAGYAIEKEKISVKLSDGSEMQGQKSVATKDGDKDVYQVLACEEGGSSFLAVTLLTKNLPKEDAEMFDIFWKTLKPKR